MLSAIFVSVAAAASIAAGHLAPTLDLGNRTLALASCGVRETLWIDHYVAGLYMAPRVPVTAVTDPAQPKAVRLKILEARYLPEQVPAKYRQAMQLELEREPMVRVRRAYASLGAGDRVTFAYLPSEGVTMSVNGRAVVRTPGHEVIDAILGAWAEEDPIAGKLQRLRLDNPC